MDTTVTSRYEGLVDADKQLVDAQIERVLAKDAEGRVAEGNLIEPSPQELDIHCTRLRVALSHPDVLKILRANDLEARHNATRTSRGIKPFAPQQKRGAEKILSGTDQRNGNSLSS